MSIEAHSILQSLADKPILTLSPNSALSRCNKKVYELMVLRRQVQIIYDLVCTPALLEHMFGEYQNLLARPSLLSLNNLLEASQGTLLSYLSKCYFLMHTHFQSCDLCQPKGRHCLICNHSQKVYPYEIVETSVCQRCGHLYHKRCLDNQHCTYCALND